MEKLYNFQKIFNNFISDFLKHDVFYEKIHNSLSYSVINGGKRLRPWIIYELGLYENISERNLLLSGTAVEILHTSTLIHDDLPSIDNSDLRRGNPTNHKVFGESSAVLAGDYGFLYPLKIFDLLDADKNVKYNINNLYTDTVLKIFEGESMDVSFETTENISLEETEKMYLFKTGVLFGFSFSLPFIISRKADFMKYYDIGCRFGKAFQIYDDIKDLTSDEISLGKDTGKDVNKKTYVSHYGIKKSNENADKIFESVTDDLKSCGLENFSFTLQNIKNYIKNR